MQLQLEYLSDYTVFIYSYFEKTPVNSLKGRDRKGEDVVNYSVNGIVKNSAIPYL